MSDPDDTDDLYVAGYDGAGQLDTSETLTGDNTQDPLDAGYTVPDYRPSAGRDEETAEEMIQGESLDKRLSEENPDVGEDGDPLNDILADEADRRAAVAARAGDDADLEQLDDSIDADEQEPYQRTGRLVSPSDGADPAGDTDEVATDVGRAGYAASAEEAAMHTFDEDEPQ